MLPGSTNRLYAQSSVDAAQSAWYFGWSAHALVHGENPFLTHLVNVPFGLNLAQATAVPLLGFLLAPVTLLAGPVSAATLCIVAAMPISAAAAYFVLRHWRLTITSSAVGGLMYGFSPYCMSQAPWHLQMVFVPLPPLIVAAVVRLVTKPAEVRKTGMLIGGLSILQYLISAEVLAMTALCCLAGFGLVCLHLRRKHRRLLNLVLRRSVPSLAIAGSLFVLVLAYPLWLQFAGPHRYHGTPWGTGNPWYADLFDLVAPSPRQAFAPWLRPTGNRLTALVGVENGTYLGVLVIVLVALIVRRGRRSLAIRVAAETAVASVILSLGPALQINGRRTGIPLPFRFLAKLPGLQDILPIRFGLTTALCIAGVVALGLDKAQRAWEPARNKPEQRTPHRIGPASRFYMATCLVVVASWWPRWPYGSETIVAPSPSVLRHLPSGRPILLSYPYPIAPESRPMLWQAISGMKFRLLGAYGLMPGPEGQATTAPPLLAPPALQEYLAQEFMGAQSPYPEPPANVAAQARTFLTRYGVTAILVDRKTRNGVVVAQFFQRVLGPPATVDEAFSLWVSTPAS